LYVLFVAGASLPLIVPYLMRTSHRPGTRHQLARMQDWLGRHGRILVAITSLVLGVIFVLQGISALDA
jgi:hypothetical protein